jgi:hypothetical protein
MEEKDLEILQKIADRYPEDSDEYMVLSEPEAKAFQQGPGSNSF